LPLDPDLAELALCAQTDPDIFFAENGNKWQPASAKKICAQCTIAKECLEYAVQVPSIEDHGIWAGTVPRERDAIRQKRQTTTYYLNRLKEERNENNKKGEAA
jgi:WhiB family redox-sensing transcriptional regulator